MSVTELFANQPFTTVISGGTDLTSTSWTVSSSTPFPTAQTGISQFHISDTDTSAASEIILVTNVDPVTNVWTVVRGAEGTTPVAHEPGFTITQVLTAGWLNDVAGSSLPAASAGALLYGNPAADAAWLAGPTTSTKEFLTSAGSGGTANTPAWGTLVSADIPNPLNQNTTGTAGNVTGIVAVLNGGTGGTSATAYAVVTGGTSATAPFQRVASPGTAGQALTSNGAGSLPSWQQTFTGLMEPLTSPVTFSASPYSASAGQYVPADTTSGNVVINLPSSPADKAIVGIKHVIQGGTNTVTWNTTGGAVINKTGGGTTGTLTLASQGVITQYAAAGTIWYVYSDDLPLGQLDARYVLESSLPLSVTLGGTGKGTLSTFGILAGGTATTTPVQQIATAAAGQVLTATGVGTLPTFQANIGFSNPMTAHGDTIYENAALAPAALPGNTTSTKNFLTSTGSGGTANSPQWGTIASADVPVLNQSTTGMAANVTGVVAVANGGTGGTQATAYAVVTGGTAATTPFQTVSGAGTSGQVLTSAGAGALPAWQALPAAGASTGGTVTLAGDLAGGPSSPQVTSTHLAAALPVTQGGTGGTAATAYAVVTGGTSATTSLQTVPGLGTSGQSLVSNGASALPTWQTPAGRILSTYHYAPTTQTGFGISSTTPAAFGSGTIATQAFTAPPSGNVLITMNFMLVTSAAGVYVAMYLSPSGSATTISSDVIQYESPAGGFSPQQAFPFYLTGLNSGTSYNYDLIGACTSGQSGTIVAYTQTSYPPTLGTLAVRGGPVIVTIQAV